ncbi:Putative ribonuclease H protein At1g65750 [Linum perenne]
MVHVWGDQSLHDDNNLCVSTAADALLHGLRVCDLRIPNENAWDMDLIEAIFEKRDAKEISNVPLGVGGNVDHRIWHYDKKGAYTVRSAYRVLMNYITPHEDLHVNGSWTDLWNLKVPPKMKNFIWRLARRVVPTRFALRSRYVDVPAPCGICGYHQEDYGHFFLSCPYATDCWVSTGLQGTVSGLIASHPNFNDWVTSMLSDTPEPSRCGIIATLWGIWRERNRRVWTNEACSAWTAMKLAHDELKNWSDAQSQPPRPQNAALRPACSSWHAPPRASWKCNSDISFSADNKMGMGLVLRDDEGRVHGFYTWHGIGSWTAREGEAAALLCAMRWIGNTGHAPVIFEIDAETVGKAIADTDDDVSEFGCLI